MRRRITFFIISNTGTPVRKAVFSRSFLYVMAFFMIGCIGVAAYGIRDYLLLKNRMLDSNELHRRIAYQRDEISVQRKQLQKFAEDINSLKQKIVSLNDFENQIRMVAGLKKTDSSGLFGIGGSIPEDMDPTIDLAKKHDSLIREMHDRVERIDIASINQRQGFESLLNSLNKQRNLLACTPAIQPAQGLITSKFGYRNSPFTGQNEFHKGLDIANNVGTPIISPADGRVTFSGDKGFLGKTIVIDHGHGFVTQYGHIEKFLKKEGENVKRGDVIATIGNSGRTTGPHVHYEVLLNGTPVNPEQYILD